MLSASIGVRSRLIHFFTADTRRPTQILLFSHGFTHTFFTSNLVGGLPNSVESPHKKCLFHHETTPLWLNIGPFYVVVPVFKFELSSSYTPYLFIWDISKLWPRIKPYLRFHKNIKPERLWYFVFYPSQRKTKIHPPLRSLRLCGELSFCSKRVASARSIHACDHRI